MSDSNSCDINAKNSCCSPAEKQPSKDLKSHWDKAYSNNPHEKLGWFETDLSPSLSLIEATGINKDARILNIGAGSTVLVDELLEQGFKNIIATDISPVSLGNMEERIGSNKVEIIVDDLTNATNLDSIEPVDLWFDRAVLHFFTEEKDQKAYFALLHKLVKKNGFVILAEFALDGALKCSGLDVHRYSNELYQEKLGDEFTLLNTFDYTYTMPSGDPRAYIYSLFVRN